MEETGGFEPPALRFCKPFHWTTLARLHLDYKLGYNVTHSGKCQESTVNFA